MKKISIKKEYKEVKKLKLLFFSFFHKVNEYRNIDNFFAIFFIFSNILQICYFLDFLFVGKNLNESSKYYKSFIELDIYDPVRILYKFVSLIPLLEYNENIFKFNYPIILIIFYIINLVLIICIIMAIRAIIFSKNISMILILNIISTSFLFFQNTVFNANILIFLYPFYGTLTNISPWNHLEFKIINMFLIIFNIILSFLFSFFNNDAVNQNENFLCREDNNNEIVLNLIRIILLICYISNFSQALINSICLFCLFILIVDNYKILEKKYYNHEMPNRVYKALIICILKIYFDGFLAIFWGIYLKDYSFGIIITFILSLLIFKYRYKKLRGIIFNLQTNDLKNIDDVLSYTSILEDEISKSIINNPLSCSRLSGFLIDHRNHCNSPNCCLKNEGDLFLPLINKSSRVEINSDIDKLAKNEILLIHLVKEIFLNLSNKFYGKSKYHFAYASFLLFRFGNIKLALIEIENSKQFANSIQEEFSFYILKQVANQRLINNQYYISKYAKNNITIIDILDVIVFENLSIELETQIFDCARLKRDLWKMLLKNNIKIEYLYQKGTDYINKKDIIDKIWKQLNQITSQNQKILNIYNEYLIVICDNQINNLNKEIKINKNIEDNDEEIEDLVETRFYDDICIFIINLTFGKDIGKITYYNTMACKLFDVKPDELINQNIGIIMPKTISKFHNNMLKTFLETGKTRVTGTNTSTFIRMKNHLIKPINLLVMPIPNFSDKSQALGILRSIISSNFYIIFDECGVIDSYTENFSLFDESFRLETFKENFGDDVDFFIFYLFPFLLQPIEHLGNKPLFLNESTLMESCQSQMYAYFDRNLFYILAEIMENLNNDKLNNKNSIKQIRKSQIKIKFEFEKLNEEEKRKYLIYKNFCKSLLQMKEMLKRGTVYKYNYKGRPSQSKSLRINGPNLRKSIILNQHMGNKIGNENLDNFNDNCPYIEQYLDYKNYLEERSDLNKLNRNNLLRTILQTDLAYSPLKFTENKNSMFLSPISKKIFNSKISIFKFNNVNKIFVMELSIPPNDLDNIYNNSIDNLNDDTNNSNKLHIDTNKSNNLQIQEEIKKNKIDFQTETSVSEDTGSVSSNVKLSFNSMFHLIQKIRDEKRLSNVFQKATYMNLMFYLLILILLIFGIFFCIYSNSLSSQLKNLFSAFIHYNKIIQYFLVLRKNSFIELKRIYLKNNNLPEFPNINLYNINDTLAINAANLLICSKNISKILYKISENSYVNDIDNLNYNTGDNINEHYTTISEVENRLIKCNIYITNPNNLKNEIVINLLSNYLNIEISENNFSLISVEERENRLNYIIEHTTNIFFENLWKKNEILKELFFKIIDKTKNTMIFCYISLGLITFIILIIVFILLKKMYTINKKIIEKFTTIKREDINDIIITLEEFILNLKKENYSIEKFLKHEEDNKIKNTEISFEEQIENFNENDDFNNLYNNNEINDENELANLIKNDEKNEKSGSKITKKTIINEKIKNDLNNQNEKEKNKKNLNSKHSDSNDNNNNNNNSINQIKRKANIFLVFSMNIFSIIIIIIAYLIVTYIVVVYFQNKYKLYYNLLMKILISRTENEINLSNIFGIFLFDNKIYFNNSLKNNIIYSKNIYDQMRLINLEIFTFYSKNKNGLSKNTQKKLENIFYNNFINNFIDENEKINFDFDFEKIFKDGFEYALNYYQNQIRIIIDIFNRNENSDLYDLFIKNNFNFIVCNFLNTNYFQIVYSYFSIILDEQFNNNSKKSLIFLIVFYCLCIFILFLTICTKWIKYFNQLKQEEFISIKLIAEIPIYITMKNDDILSFLKSFSRKDE